MAFWSTETLEDRLEARELIEPYRSGRIKHGAYELSMGNEFFKTTDETKVTLDEKQQQKIPAGQIALLLTEEVIRVPDDTIALISMKASIKMSGLINISGFHVDPGFEGRLKFSVYNAGTTGLPVTRGTPMFLIWFVSLDRTTSDTYEGGRIGVDAITDEDVARLPGEISSPAELRHELDELKSTFERLRNAGIAVLSTVLTAALGAVLAVVVPMFFDGCSSEKNSSPDGMENATAHIVSPAPSSLVSKGGRSSSATPLYSFND